MHMRDPNETKPTTLGFGQFPQLAQPVRDVFERRRQLEEQYVALCESRRLLAEEFDVVVKQRDDLLFACKYAAEMIGDCQKVGCPAGPVAIPSLIRDAILASDPSWGGA